MRQDVLVRLFHEAGWNIHEFDILLAHADPERGLFLEADASIRISNPDQLPENVFVGRRSYMLGGGLLSPHTVIGRYCSISANASVGVGRHAMDRISTGKLPPCSHPLRTPETPLTVIGHDVWIGVGATVVGGCRVGTGACIGAGAVVTHDIPPYAVAAGVPARMIRPRFPEAIAARLLDTRWWTLPEDIIAQMPYDDMDACLDFLDRLRRPPESPKHSGPNIPGLPPSDNDIGRKGRPAPD